MGSSKLKSVTLEIKNYLKTTHEFLECFRTFLEPIMSFIFYRPLMSSIKTTHEFLYSVLGLLMSFKGPFTAYFLN